MEMTSMPFIIATLTALCVSTMLRGLAVVASGKFRPLEAEVILATSLIGFAVALLANASFGTAFWVGVAVACGLMMIDAVARTGQRSAN